MKQAVAGQSFLTTASEKNVTMLCALCGFAIERYTFISLKVILLLEGNQMSSVAL